MFRVPPLAVLLGLVFCVLASNETMSQRFDESGVVYEAARNKIGLIRYCRNNALLDRAIADRAVKAMETGLGKLPVNNPLAREDGDRAQQAGEDGYWEAGRRRDIAGIAALFRTTPKDLCKEWADETLRAQEPSRREPVTTLAEGESQSLPQAEPTPVKPIQTDSPPARATAEGKATRSKPLQFATIAGGKPIQPLAQAEPTPVKPIQADSPPASATAVGGATGSTPLRIVTIPGVDPIPPLPQAEPTPVEPKQADSPPDSATPVVRDTRSAPLRIVTIASVEPILPLAQAAPTPVEPIQADRAARSAPPPLPEKAPFLPTEAELASLQRPLPSGGRLASTGRAVSGHTSSATVLTSGAGRSSEQAVPLPARLANEEMGPFPRERRTTAATPPRPFWGKWPFNQQVKSDNSQEKRWRYPLWEKWPFTASQARGRSRTSCGNGAGDTEGCLR